MKSLVKKHARYWTTLKEVEQLAAMEYVESMNEYHVSSMYQEAYEKARAEEIRSYAEKKSEKIRKKFPAGITGRVEHILETLSDMDRKSDGERISSYLL